MPPQKLAVPHSASVISNRKPYAAPDVVEYGSLSDITLSLGSTGKNDGGQNPPNKTSLP